MKPVSLTPKALRQSVGGASNLRIVPPPSEFRPSSPLGSRILLTALPPTFNTFKCLLGSVESRGTIYSLQHCYHEMGSKFED